MKLKVPLVLALIFGFTTNALPQQQTPAPTPPSLKPTETRQPQKPDELDVVRITTNLVQVDAVITDKNGKVVTDLKPEEVQIFEDGRQQKVTNFSYVVTETAGVARPDKPATTDKNLPAPPPRLKPEDVRRTIALVVDDLGLSFQSTHFVRRALKKFVDEQMQPGDLVAIVRTGGGMGALQQFTSDKRQLYAAIERVKWYMNGRGGTGAFAALVPPTPGAFGPEIDAKNEELNEFRDDLFAVGTLGAVSYVVKGLRALPGRKSVLLISDGFRIYNREDAMRSYLALQRLRRLIDEAGRASVVIYTLNAAGLQHFGLTAADSTGERSAEQIEEQLSNRRNAAFETQEGLDFLAKETGGIAIRNTNDLGGGIRRVLEDQKGYYLIGYRPDQSTFDLRSGRRQFHKLSLKVTRPGKFTVRMRNGFFGVSDEERPAQRPLAQQLFGALLSPFGATGVHLQLTSLFGHNAKAGSFMRSLLHVDARDLTFTNEPDGSHKCVFDLLAMTFGDNGIPVDQGGGTYTIRLTDAMYKRTLRDGLVYNFTVPIKKPGAYQFRLSLRDSSTERVGSVSQFIEVPDLKKKRLALSGLIVRGADPGRPANNAGQTDQKQEGLEEGNAEAGPAVRHFRHGMRLNYFFVIFNARVDKATQRPQLLTQVRLLRDGNPIFTGKESGYEFTGQADLKQLIAAGALQLGTDLAPGEYLLQIIVKDLLADEKHRTATQWINLEIVK